MGGLRENDYGCTGVGLGCGCFFFFSPFSATYILMMSVQISPALFDCCKTNLGASIDAMVIFGVLILSSMTTINPNILIRTNGGVIKKN